MSKLLTMKELRLAAKNNTASAVVVNPTISATVEPTAPPEEILSGTKQHEIPLLLNVLTTAVFKANGYAEYDDSLPGTCLMVVLGAINAPGTPLESFCMGNASYVKANGDSVAFMGDTLVSLNKAGYLSSEYVPTAKMASLLDEHLSTQFSLTPLVANTEGDCHNMKVALDHLSSCEVSHAVEYAAGLKEYFKGGYRKGSDSERKVFFKKVRQTEQLMATVLNYGDAMLYQVWKHDHGGRVYPTVWNGGNTQGGDVAKAFLTYPKDRNSTEYDSELLLSMLLSELEGCVSLRGDELLDFISDMSELSVPKYLTSQVQGLPNGVKDKSGVEGSIKPIVKPKKVNMFKRWADDYAALYMHVHGGGDKPVLTAMIGPDATASGVMIASLVANAWRLLRRTGFVEGAHDVYIEFANRMRKHEKNPIDLDRSKAKEVVVAGIYGQGAGGLIRAGYTAKVAYAMFRELHSMLGPISKIMADMAGSIHFGNESFVNDHVAYKVPDGHVVDKKRWLRFDWNGNPVDKDSKKGDREVNLAFGKMKLPLGDFTINSDQLDTERMASTAFVTLIHALDALMLRAMLVEMEREGIWCFPAHDCLYVMPKDMLAVRDIIDNVYFALFTGDDPLLYSSMFSEGTDCLQLFYQGVARSRIDGAQPVEGVKSQFFDWKGKSHRLFKGIPVLDENGQHVLDSEGKWVYNSLESLLGEDGMSYWH